MWTILTRCRDADMLGPVCDVISDDKPLTDSIREMRVHAAIHNEPKITEEDLMEIDELATAREECCEEECCCC